MGIVGNLYDKLCGFINGKRICGIANERGIPFGYGFSGSSKIYAIHKYPGGTKRLGKIECHGAISLKKQTVGSTAVRIAVSMEGREVWIFPKPCYIAWRRGAGSKILRNEKLVGIEFPVVHKEAAAIFRYYGCNTLHGLRFFCILIVIDRKQPYSCQREENGNGYG